MRHSTHVPLTRRRFLQTSAAAAGAVALARPAATGAARDGAGPVWLPGELHAHTCHSHDVWCVADDNTGPEEIYTAGFGVAQRFADARLRGLRYLAITDHDDVRSHAELPAGGPVLALPAYECSVRGHAQILGARRAYDKGDGSVAAVQALAAALRADGGVFQANHPAYRLDQPFTGCSCGDCGALHWKYGFAIRPDTIEVWNPSAPPNAVAEAWWECWLERGERIGATGGSDSHWAALSAVAGLGQPTTWVLAPEPTVAGVLAGLRAGRTTISAQPPALGGVQLLLSGPGGATAGDEVRAGARVEVRALGLAEPALVRVRANGEDVAELPLAPGGAAELRAPARGWLRVTLLGARPAAGLPPQQYAELPVRDGHPLLALSSAMFVAAPVVAGAVQPRLVVERRVRTGLLVGPGLPVAVVGAGDAPVRFVLRARGRVLARATGPGEAVLRPPRAVRAELRRARRPVPAVVEARSGGRVLRRAVTIRR